MNENLIFRKIRNSRMSLEQVYFWTDTIKDWKHLLKKDKYKQIIIDQLKWLVDKKKIKIYGFVIMPNHLHLLWELREMNGKEMPHASFNKWTSNNFLNDLRINHPQVLSYFIEITDERKHRFWQRDPLQYLWIMKRNLNKNLITFTTIL
jgi:putative transposase